LPATELQAIFPYFSRFLKSTTCGDAVFDGNHTLTHGLHAQIFTPSALAAVDYLEDFWENFSRGCCKKGLQMQ
jgi:hypothetical protein